MLASHQDTPTDHGLVNWMRKDQQSISWVDGATCPAGPATPFGISSSRIWISVDSLVSFQFDELFLGMYIFPPELHLLLCRNMYLANAIACDIRMLLHTRCQATNKKEQMPPRRGSLLTRGFEFRVQPIKIPV